MCNSYGISGQTVVQNWKCQSYKTHRVAGMLPPRRSSPSKPFAALFHSSLDQVFRVLSWCPVFTAAIRTTKTRVEGKIPPGFCLEQMEKEDDSVDSLPFSLLFLNVPKPLLGDDGGRPPHHCEIVRAHWPLLGCFSQVFILVIAEPGDRLRNRTRWLVLMKFLNLMRMQVKIKSDYLYQIQHATQRGWTDQRVATVFSTPTQHH